jgi:hypothetical protein
MLEIPRINLPQFDLPAIVSLTVAEIKALSDAELLEILSGESKHEGIIPGSLQQLITAELLERSLAKSRVPHWSVLPSFCLLITSVVLALIGVIVALATVPQVQQLLSTTQPVQPSIAPAPNAPVPSSVATSQAAPAQKVQK